ncbi:MAG: GNAT family N-acetyltransferase [Ruminococcus sp.]|nr:GNAT family N-acetyltransferase [Ruminococcus sp.]
MRLRPYISDTDFNFIRKWDTDERTHALWCAGRLPFPVTRESMDLLISDHAVKYGDTPFTATEDDDTPVGFFCIATDVKTNTSMLRFVIVDSSLRGRGYGREMLSLAVKYAFDIVKADTVQLNVFTSNEAAKKCYLSVGFTERSVTPDVFTYKDESWGRCNMIITR